MNGAELSLEQTREVSRLRHQLALGLSFIDSNTLQGAMGPLVCSLERIGSMPLELSFEAHRKDRLALRFEGIVHKRMLKLLADGLSTTWTLRAFGCRAANALKYLPNLDPHLYVPRRLSMELVLAGTVPASSIANIRAPWLWPAAGYPFAAGSTLLRGRVLRGVSSSAAAPIAWARVFATVPDSETLFEAAQLVGCAHGDGRGEFALALDARAATGAALKNPLKVRLWVFAAPAGASPNPADPLALLPIEACGSALKSDVLTGIALPPSYSLQQSRVIDVRLGETLSGADTEFLFAP